MNSSSLEWSPPQQQAEAGEGLYLEAENTGANHLLATAASERAGIRTEAPAVKETDGAQLRGKLGSFALESLTHWPKMCQEEWKTVRAAANCGVPTDPWGT